MPSIEKTQPRGFFKTSGNRLNDDGVEAPKSALSSIGENSNVLLEASSSPTANYRATCEFKGHGLGNNIPDHLSRKNKNVTVTVFLGADADNGGVEELKIDNETDTSVSASMFIKISSLANKKMRFESNIFSSTEPGVAARANCVATVINDLSESSATNLKGGMTECGQDVNFGAYTA